MNILICFNVLGPGNDIIRLKLLQKGYNDHYINHNQTVMLPLGTMISNSVASIQDAVNDMESAAKLSNFNLIHALAVEYSNALGKAGSI